MRWRLSPLSRGGRGSFSPRVSNCHSTGLASAAIGLHGLEEWSPEGTVTLREGVSSWRPVIEKIYGRLVDAVPIGVRVEDKGYGITAHWRSVTASAAELEAIRTQATGIVTMIGTEYGLEARPGKASVELALPLGIDKGSVLTELSRGLEAAAYLGDDLGDLRAFRALDVLVATFGLRGVKIAVNGDEAPGQLLKEADLVLDGPNAAALFLEALGRSCR